MQKKSVFYFSDFFILLYVINTESPSLQGEASFLWFLETADNTQGGAQCSKGSDDNLDDELDDILLRHKANYEVGVWSYELRSTFYLILAEGDTS